MNQIQEENFKTNGSLKVIIANEFGEVTKEFSVTNLVVTTGKNWITSRLKDSGPAQMSHMAVGTDVSATAVAVGDTALTTALGPRIALTTAGGTVANNVITYTATFPANVTYVGAITEAGIFNDLTGATMLCRTKFLAVNKAATDTMTIEWTVTAS